MAIITVLTSGESGANSLIDINANFANLNAALLAITFAFANGEVPTGSVNGVNTTFTLAHTPGSGGVTVFVNGLRFKNTVDYTISGATITMTTAPETNDLILVDYHY